MKTGIASTVLTPLSAYKKLKQGNTFYYQEFEQNTTHKKQATDNINPFALILNCHEDAMNNAKVFGLTSDEFYSLNLSGGSITGELIKKAERVCVTGDVKIMVIMSHTGCNLVETACNNAGCNTIEVLANKIRTAIDLEQSITYERHGSNNEFVEKVMRLHVKNMTEEIIDRSPILRHLIQSGSLGITGCIHNTESGKVTFLHNCIVLGSVWVNE